MKNMINTNWTHTLFCAFLAYSIINIDTILIMKIMIANSKYEIGLWLRSHHAVSESIIPKGIANRKYVILLVLIAKNDINPI